MKYFISLVLFVSLFFSPAGFAQRKDFWDIKFKKADSIAWAYAGHPLKKPDKLAESLTRDLNTDVEKFRAIFMWIADNISYDYQLYKKKMRKEQKFKRQRDKLSSFRRKFAKKVYAKTIRHKMSICSGYSMLLEYMSNQVGLNCEYVSGFARTGEQQIGSGVADHAWNAVKLNNKWYLCDATWASGSYDPIMKKFRKEFDKNYFLTDPSLFVANHFPVDTAWMLLYDKPTLREFLDAPVKSLGYFENQINQYVPANGVIRTNPGKDVIFKFTSNSLEMSPTATVRISGNNFYREDKIELKKDDEGFYSFRCKFDKRGSLDLHIYINYKLTLSYSVYVK